MSKEAATWPRVEAILSSDGTAEISIGGNIHTLRASAVDDARRQTVALIAARAAQLGRPLRAFARDPEGAWSIIVHEDGTVEADNAAEPRQRFRPAPQPEPRVDWRAVDSPAKHIPSTHLTLTPQEHTPVNVTDNSGLHPDSFGQEPTSPQTKISLHTFQSPQLDQRQSFLNKTLTEKPATATKGWRGAFRRIGLRLKPSAAEQAERNDAAAVSQHWDGPRTITIVNSKGGAGKTPSTILLAAVFAHYGGAGVLAWDNNQTRGTLGWRTEQGPHDSTLLDLLPQTERLLRPNAQAADLGYFVHYQTHQRFDVLRSKPTALAHEQRIEPEDVDAIHAVASKYYRIIFADSGNDESDPMWLRMIDHTDQLVVATTTRDDHAEAGALLLEALSRRDARSAHLATQAVAIVTQADSTAPTASVIRVANGYQEMTRETVTIPFDPAMVDGLLRYDSLRPPTRRAWLAAAAAVARGL